MIGSFVSRWPFLAAVALVSAAVSDVLVESIANTGAFGVRYFDTDDSSIAPSLLVALGLAGYVIVLHALALSRRSRRLRRDWLAVAARQIATHAPMRDFPAIAVMQFAALFVMENVEGFVATGHGAGGLMWLGGPLLLGGCIHLAVGALCTLLAGWFMHVSLACFASLVGIAFEFALCARSTRGSAAAIVRRDAASCSHAQPAFVRHISGRAPPFSLTAA